jgi:transposase
MGYGGGMIPYPSDLTAAQWALIEPLLPAAKTRGRKRKVDLRSITNAIFYVLKGGITWTHVAARFRSMEDRVPLLSPLAPHRTVGPNPRSASG